MLDETTPKNQMKVPSSDLDSRILKSTFAQDTEKASSQLFPDNENPDTWQPGSMIPGGFRIDREIGNGGMGIVYQVTDIVSTQTFAMKVLKDTHYKKYNSRRLFLRELRTWIDLAPFPHLIMCRFFRTINRRIAIFSELIDGGSLHEYIKYKKIDSIKTILDYAIQSAWGLHAAHIQGVIHQDVKPSNMLINCDGLLKITDFGLSRLLRKHRESNCIPTDSDLLVTSSGYTLAYCSPEQFENKKLDHRTDIWSWGVSILNMFTGKINWNRGFSAGIFLDYHRNNPAVFQITIPDCLYPFFKKCFQIMPADRWSDLFEASKYLMDIYPKLTGEQYERPIPVFPERDSQPKKIFPHRTAIGLAWENPEEVLAKALKITGKNSEILNDYKKERRGSIKSQQLLDLEMFEYVERIYKEINPNHYNLEFVFNYIQVLRHKCLVLRNLHDYTGAVESLNICLDVIQKNERQTDPVFMALKAKIYNELSIISFKMNHYLESIQFATEAIDLWERLDDISPDTEFKCYLASAYGNLANALWRNNHLDEAINHINDALQILSDIDDDDPQKQFENKIILVRLTMNKAVLLTTQEKNLEAIYFLNSALKEMQVLVFEKGHSELTLSLSRLIQNLAGIYAKTEKFSHALEKYNASISIIQNFDDLHREDKISELALIYANKAHVLQKMGKISDSLEWLNQAIVFRGELVERLGRRNLIPQLASNYFQMGRLLYENKNYQQALFKFSEAIKWLHSATGDQIPFKLEMCHLLFYRGICHEALGHLSAAVKDWQKAKMLFESINNIQFNENIREIILGVERKLSEAEPSKD